MGYSRSRPEANPRFWKAELLAPKYLWKLLFDHHSHFRLKMALWMLWNERAIA